jgi:hypothetical protein
MSIKYYIRKVKRFFKKIIRLVSFVPVIWKGEDWDYRYAIDLFQFQLLRMADCIEKYGNHTHSEHDAKRIRLVCRLMTKVYDEEYAMEHMDIMKERYGDDILKINFEDSGNGLSRMTMAYEKREDSEEIKRTFHELRDCSDAQQERAHRLLWQLIEKDIRRWWD